MQAVLPTLLAQERDFLIAGPRLVFPKGVIWDPNQTSWKSFKDEWVTPRKYEPITDAAIDWFVFRRGSYDFLPPFELGRYVWDSYMVDRSTRRYWNSVTTLMDGDDHTTYGLHWEHDRSHQASKNGNSDDERSANWRVARRFGGLGRYGRLRGMELGLKKNDEGQYGLFRRFDKKHLGLRLKKSFRF